MLITRVTVALIGLTVYGVATAQGVAQEAQTAFDRLDADGSGAITWAEAYDVRTRAFMNMDTNMDGIVAEDEFEGPARPLSAFDSDRDGELHLAEFLRGHWSMFDRFDKDRDGALTFNEFEAARSAARGN